MASRLYPSTRDIFLQVVRVLTQLSLQNALSQTCLAHAALYILGLILLESRQTPWRIQQWLPARSHDALNRLLRVQRISTRAIMAALIGFCRTLPVTGYLCLDNVVIEKDSSRKLAWTGWLYSHADKRKVYGLDPAPLKGPGPLLEQATA